jgi:2-haloacid dehalogenase
VPERTLFIDDVQHNVDAARAAGWQALRFESPAQLGAELRGRGLI